jgi:EAL domain-containing protein (putative c-di-GMP-specific phosphodiesterase class I)/ActR/RegA family two-component response regulator
VRSLKVLILEDNAFQMMALHQMLNANQVFDVLTADSVAAAERSLARRGRVDIAICDLQMDGPDGLSLIGHLAQNDLASAVIILSSAELSVMDGVAQLARQQGIEVLGCLQKPASVATLGQLLGRWQRKSVQPVAPFAMPAAEPFSQDELHQLEDGQSVDDGQDYPQWIAHYQPKVSLTGELMGVELLARWQHPTRGLLAPGQFIPALEDAGLMEALTWRMLEQGLALSSRRLRLTGRALPVAVNIPPAMLDQADFVPHLLAMLERFPVRAQMLTLEVVEQSSRQMAVVQFENLLRLRMAGCRLSIDDFGTGASNIQRLLEMPFSELKIPAEFVRGMADDRRKSAVVAGAMYMAQRMALDVVIEGVETAEDFHALLQFGEPAIQGYFIARPMAEADLLQWIEAYRRHPPLVAVSPVLTTDHAPEGK